MTRIFTAPAFALVACVALTPRAGQAADTRHAQANAHRRHHADANTTDPRVDQLNEGQLNRNYRGPWYYPTATPAPNPNPSAVSYPPPASPLGYHPTPAQPSNYPPPPPGSVPSPPPGEYVPPTNAYVPPYGPKP